jgi:hypothetical protein
VGFSARLKQSVWQYLGGESGIRTHVTLSSKHAFQACAFSHSAISPATNLLQDCALVGSYCRDSNRRPNAAIESSSILWPQPLKQQGHNVECSTSGIGLFTKRTLPKKN